MSADRLSSADKASAVAVFGQGQAAQRSISLRHTGLRCDIRGLLTGLDPRLVPLLVRVGGHSLIGSSALPAGRILGTMSRSARLGVVLGLNLSLIAALVIVGVGAHSLGVVAEGVDYLADAAAIVASLIAIRLAQLPRRRPSARLSRATLIAALVNAGWLLVLVTAVAVASIQRLATGAREVHGLPVLIVSAVAAVVMFIGALVLLGDDDDGDPNMRAVLLDTAGDAAAAAGVACVGRDRTGAQSHVLARSGRCTRHRRSGRIPRRQADRGGHHRAAPTDQPRFSARQRVMQIACPWRGYVTPPGRRLDTAVVARPHHVMQQTGKPSWRPRGRDIHQVFRRVCSPRPSRRREGGVAFGVS